MRFRQIIGSEQELKILDELAQVIEIWNGWQDTLKLICDSRSGYWIKYEKNKKYMTLHYHKLTDLCRGYVSVVKMEPEDSFEETAVCAFEELGVMLDCSRNAVPTVPTLKKMIRYLAAMGYSFLGLYTEDTLEVKEEPYFGYMRGRYTADEIREVDTYAHMFGMELRPYIQTLAHMNQIIRYQEYKEITDTDDILLMGENRTFTLLDHILQTVSSVYQTRKINIGMDEAEMVGLGRYLQLHGYQDRRQLMQNHLEKVLELCKKYDLEPQMWSDMFFKMAFDGEYYITKDPHCEEVQSRLKKIAIPEGLQIVYWDYYHLSEAYYDQMLEAHQMLTNNTAFAAGAWKWSGLVPHNRSSIRAGAASFAACKKRNISSVTVTCWGDNGAEADPFSVLPTIYMDAQFAWEKRDLGNLEEENATLFTQMDSKGFEVLTGLPLEKFILLDDANPHGKNGLYHTNASKYLLYDDLFMGIFSSLLKPDTKDQIRKTGEVLDNLAETTTPFGYLFKTEAALCCVLYAKIESEEKIRHYYAEKNREKLQEVACKDLQFLIEKLDRFYQIFKEQWYFNEKNCGLEVQTIRIGGLRQRILDCGELLRQYADGKIEKIEVLEAQRLDFAYRYEEIEKLDFNIWSVNVSPACIG